MASESLRSADRAADGRSTIYAQTLRDLCRIADLGAGAVPTGVLWELADRMDGGGSAVPPLQHWESA